MHSLTKEIFDKVQQVERQNISFEELCGAIWEIELRIPKEELLSINERTYAWALAHRADQPKSLALAEVTFGIYHFYTASYKQAVQFQFEALSRFRSLQDQAGMGLAMANLGAVYRSLGDLDMALEFITDGLKWLKETGKYQKFACYGAYGIAEMYVDMGRYEASLSYYEEALAIGQSLDDNTGIVRSFNGMANAYRKLKQFDKALNLLEVSLEKNQEGNISFEARVLTDLGDFYFETENYEKSLSYYRKSLALRQEHGLRDASITSQLGIARVLHKQGYIEDALTVGAEALGKAEEIGVKAKLFAIHFLLSGLFEQQENTEKAFYHFRLYHDLKEEVIDENSRKKVDQMQTMHEAILNRKSQESEHYKSLSRQLQSQNKYIEAQNEELQEKERAIEDLYAQEHQTLQELRAAMKKLQQKA